jgi:DNA-binding transcriptional ArsR family regulator
MAHVMDLRKAIEATDVLRLLDLREEVVIGGRSWDAVANVDASGQSLKLGIEEKRSVDPRWAEKIALSLAKGHGGGPIPIVAAPYIGPTVRRRLEAAGIGWLDENGNIHVRHKNLLLHIEKRPPRGSIPPPGRRLFSPANSRVAQALLESPRSVHTLESLAKAAYLQAPSTVSRALSAFAERGFVERRRDGWRLTDARALTDQWLDTSLARPEPEKRDFFAAESVSHLMHQIAGVQQNLTGVKVFLTGLSAAELIDPLVPAGRVDAYVFPPSKSSQVARRFKWVPTEEVTTVRLFLAQTAAPRIGATRVPHYAIVGRAQLLLDLLREGGRAMQAADVLRDHWQI